MDTAFWESVAARGRSVPQERPLAELTTELTRMLGDTDPYVRVHLAETTLRGWIEVGVYDDLLTALGDGMAAGLTAGLGEDGTPSVFRRSSSASVLATCIERENAHRVTAEGTIHRWGDALMGWFVRERDLRGYVPDCGWAGAINSGADALGVLAASPSMGALELTVILDVLADRAATETEYRFDHGEDDRLALATLAVLRRDLVELKVIEPWITRLGHAARRVNLGGDPYRVAGNVESFLRALFIALSLAGSDISVRSDLLLVLVESLRRTNPDF